MQDTQKLCLLAYDVLEGVEYTSSESNADIARAIVKDFTGMQELPARAFMNLEITSEGQVNAEMFGDFIGTNNIELLANACLDQLFYHEEEYTIEAIRSFLRKHDLEI